jgi:hypothetical protein
MLTKKSPKIAYKFCCEKCDYKCSKQSEYNKHLTTAKHKKLTNLTEKSPKISDDFTCTICKKQYKSRMGLWQHKKKCSQSEISIQENREPPQTIHDTHVFIDLLHQNQEFKQLMIEQSNHIQDLQEKLVEAVKTGGQHIENQTINNNQKFNLNFFLNEQCKDAINMSDFIENMELDLEDLTETGRLGYVGGISRILINKLQELDVYKRPLHCTDMKRETLYIKDNNEWEKQTNSKEKIGQIIGKVANKNCKNLPKWTEEHPGYEVFDSPENMEYINMTQAVLGGFCEEETRHFKDKIVRNVVKEILVGKS